MKRISLGEGYAQKECTTCQGALHV
jgi:hypothetical protein